jgi:hypothetical protein
MASLLSSSWVLSGAIQNKLEYLLQLMLLTSRAQKIGHFDVIAMDAHISVVDSYNHQLIDMQISSRIHHIISHPTRPFPRVHLVMSR